jgi:hypothetical protein
MIRKMHSPELTIFSGDWAARSLTIGFGLSLTMIQATAEIASANPIPEPESSTYPHYTENQSYDDAIVNQNVSALTATFRSSASGAIVPSSVVPSSIAAVSSAADPTASFTFRLPGPVVPSPFNAIGSSPTVNPPVNPPVSAAANPSATFAFRSSAAFVPSGSGAIGSTPAPVVNPSVAQYPYAPNVVAPSPNYASPIQSVPAPGYPSPPPGYLVPTPAYPPPTSASSSPTNYPPPGYPASAPAYPNTAYPNTAYPNTAYPTPGYPTAYPTAYPIPTGYPVPGYPMPPGYPTPGYPTAYPVPTGYPAPGYPTSAPVYPTTAYPTPGYPTTAYPTPPGYPVSPSTNPGTPGYATPVPAPQPTAQRQSALTSTALTPPSIRFQGVYELQGDESSARARVSGLYPLSPNVQFGATFDLTDGNAFSDSQTEGASINELYLAASLPNIPNLRFVIGQLDLTSYLDRNSFAKDGASQFFNSLFQTNSALTAASIGSRPGALLNWSITDNLEARAIAFSSARSISNFALDGFAGEVGLRVGNAIIRGTYVSARDGGTNSGFQEIFGISRNDGRSGIQSDDREESYGINAEFFIPQLNLGLFGRYGRYENPDLGQGGDTYSGGLSFLDLFMSSDRLGIAYGRNLSNNRLRQNLGNRTPDVLEVYYDFRLLPNLRLGFTFQELNNFSESIAGFRLRTDFDLLSRRSPSS